MNPTPTTPEPESQLEPYNTPTLTIFGDVATLTAGGGGTRMDGNSFRPA